ncbi:MAG: hypothetical protein KA479_13660, partial [Saprospiraceae bacterium]|nr:hypothetical protein [Saprospiraceae bacterium]
MLNENFLDNRFTWMIYSIALLLMYFGNYFGYRFGLKQSQKISNVQDTANGEIMGAIFGVLGFTLAFLFGMSLTRLEHKKEMVVNEASAVLMAYQNSRFLPEPYKTDCSRMIKDYASLRYQLSINARKDHNVSELKKGLLLSEQIQDSLLRAGTAMMNLPGVDASAYVASITTLVDLNIKRINNALGDRIPMALKFLMYMMSLFGLLAMGYGSGLKGGHSLIPNILLVSIFAIIIWIILDMDSPVNN